MAFNRKQYEHDQEYIKRNIKFVNIALNQKKEDDMKILDWLNSRPEGKGAYIKGLIQKDMKLEPKMYPPTRYSNTLWGCGSCGHELPEGKSRKCSYCGQLIDWSK